MTESQTDCPMTTRPQRQHEWLQQLAGRWTYESECIMAPGQPPMKATGVEEARTFGELWVIMETTITMEDGAEMRMNLTIGYDPGREQFVGSCACSPMAHLWVYDSSEWDESGNTLTLFTEGPSMNPDAAGAMAKYKDVIALKGKDEREMSSHMLGDDGQWQHFSTVTYRRKAGSN